MPNVSTQIFSKLLFFFSECMNNTKLFPLLFLIMVSLSCQGFNELRLSSSEYEQATTYPDPTPILIPLDSRLIFDFEKEAGSITLKLRTQREYNTSSNKIKVRLAPQKYNILQIEIGGIEKCFLCDTLVGPASNQVELGELEGKYILKFDYRNDSDEYELLVTPQEIKLTPISTTFTEAQYSKWYRLPSETIWFVVHDCVVYVGGNEWRPLEWSAYEQQKESFYTELEAFGVEEFIPLEGQYTNVMFVPPWSTWQDQESEAVPPEAAEEGWVYIPANKESGYLFRWPDIRYYQYDGDWSSIETLVNNHNLLDITVDGYNWKGQRTAGKKCRK